MRALTPCLDARPAALTMESSWPGPRPASGGELAAEPGVGPPYVGNDEVPPRVVPDAGGAAGNDRGASPANSGNRAGVPTAIARECAPTCAPPHTLGNSGLEISPTGASAEALGRRSPQEPPGPPPMRLDAAAAPAAAPSMILQAQQDVYVSRAADVDAAFRRRELGAAAAAGVGTGGCVNERSAMAEAMAASLAESNSLYDGDGGGRPDRSCPPGASGRAR